MSSTNVTEIRLSYPAEQMLRRMHKSEKYQVVTDRSRVPPALFKHEMVMRVATNTWTLTGRGLAWLATHPQKETEVA